jgi:protease I
LAREAAAQNKIIAAICIAPTILARAGILEGKRATVWSSALDRRPIQLIQEEGAIFENKPVVTDAKLVTATGPQAVKEFAEAIIQVSKKK